MRYLVLSDIHANIDALDAVLAAATSHGYDEVVVLGDLVGYGSEPNEVVRRVRALEPRAVVRGNHDKVAAGLESSDGFNPTAQRAATWTQEALDEEARDYLRALPEGPLVLDDLTLICHGSPVDEDTYIFGESDVVDALAASTRPLCLFGHTHLPLAAALGSDRVLDIIFQGSGDGQSATLDPAWCYLVNPGSVGQPRDGDPRASYALLDTGTREIEVHRVEYAAQQACDRILAAGLPKVLGQRLLLGR